MSWTALFAGLGAAGNTLSQIGVAQMQRVQHLEDQQREEQVWMRRQRLLESMKAPAEKSYDEPDPEKKGWKNHVTERWVPPADDNTPGHYERIAAVPIPPKFTKDKISLPNNQEQDVLLDEEGNISQKLGAPRDIFDPEGPKRTAIEAANSATSAGNLKLAQTKFIQEGIDKQNQDKVPHDRYSIHPGEGQGEYVAFDKATRRLTTIKPDQNQVEPGGGLVSDMARQPADPGEFTPKPDAFSTSPLSQFDRAPAGKTPPAQGVGPSGGAGSQGNMNATPAQGASAKGPPVAKKVINGKLWYKYADGSTAPAG